ncbi:MAG TPA: tetratricopeptide repeat protein [Pontiellaceae bacterium]|nr:tetratricopeptide repeat protein [Pontiellaceae bacterium]
MKFFRKKDTPPAGPRPQISSPDSGFYSQHAGESPLDEYSNGTRGRQTHRTSRHSPARIPETSNRAGSWAIFLLLLRAVLIVVLLVGGFFALKLALDYAAKPSKKELRRREATAALMEKSLPPSSGLVKEQLPEELTISPELIGQRLEQWSQTDRHFRSAEALSRRGIDDEAMQELGQALRASPNNRAAQQLLLNIYMRKGLYAEAVPLCIRLLDQDGWQQNLQMNLLRALQESGQTEACLLLADRILLDQPNNVTVLTAAADGRIAQGDKDAALALFEQILVKDAKNAGALEGCGRIYSERGDYQKAVPYYLELVRIDPKPVYYQTLARCYSQQNQAGKAVIFMGQAASLFGETTVAPWLRDTVFDPVRETVEFRSFADRLVGVETRKAIEAINQREAEKAETPAPDGGKIESPRQLDLKTLKK